MRKLVSGKKSKGFTLGELLTVIALTAALFLAFTPLIRTFRHRHARVECANNLKNIGIAMYMYANRNDGRFPPSLEVLYKENYLSDERMMDCPGSGSTGTLEEPDYIYVADLSLKLSENQPMLYDKDGNHPGGGAHVLMVDGEIVWKD